VEPGFPRTGPVTGNWVVGYGFDGNPVAGYGVVGTWGAGYGVISTWGTSYGVAGVSVVGDMLPTTGSPFTVEVLVNTLICYMFS
jgi:hypothetical protein